jgi:leader peptidase (prepilin peptidase)/N-methyltransferase
MYDVSVIPLFHIAGLVLSLMLGLIFGSFASAICYRIPRDISWTAIFGSRSRSFCPHCNIRLGIRDLIPVISWLFLKGRCRSCGVPLSCKYPLLEIVSACCVLTAFIVKGFSVETFILASLVPFLLALVVIDLEEMILPDQLVLICFVITFADIAWQAWSTHNFKFDLLFYHLVSAFIYALTAWVSGIITSRVAGRSALGFGDVKFFMVAGLGLGLSGLPYYLIISGGAGITIALLWKYLDKGRIFPFGPALIFAFYVLMVFT